MVYKNSLLSLYFDSLVYSWLKIQMNWFWRGWCSSDWVWTLGQRRQDTFSISSKGSTTTRLVLMTFVRLRIFRLTSYYLNRRVKTHVDLTNNHLRTKCTIFLLYLTRSRTYYKAGVQVCTASIVGYTLRYIVRYMYKLIQKLLTDAALENVMTMLPLETQHGAA